MTHLPKRIIDATKSRLVKPKSRQLTDGEKQMAYSVFRDALDMTDIQIKTAWWVLENYAVSPNGNIYFHPNNWIKDFAKESLSRQGWLIHELTHVWQRQHGLKVVRGAIINRRYNYRLIPNKSFFKYGIEQQACIVQDYFIRRGQDKDCQAFEQCIPFLDVL